MSVVSQKIITLAIFYHLPKEFKMIVGGYFDVSLFHYILTLWRNGIQESESCCHRWWCALPLTCAIPISITSVQMIKLDWRGKKIITPRSNKATDFLRIVSKHIQSLYFYSLWCFNIKNFFVDVYFLFIKLRNAYIL